jgi:hypothetical protein
VIVGFVVHEAVDFILTGEPFNGIYFVLRYAAIEIAGNADIQRPGPADQDIDPELVVETASARRRMLAQVFQRELPDAAWLQRTVSGFFDCAARTRRLRSE